MNTASILRLGLSTAAGLALTTGVAFADGAVAQPYHPQTLAPHAVEPTAQSHLEAAARALRQSLNWFTQRDVNRPEDNLITLQYGGFMQRACADLNQALTDVAAASAFVQTHPEANPLAAGPVPADEPPAPLLPALRSPMNGFTYVTAAVDNLNLARVFMTNNPAPDYHGAILGSLGGLRAKILDDLGQVGADFIAGILYDRNNHGGIISLSAPVPPQADPHYGPTTQTYLRAVEQYLQRTKDYVVSPPVLPARPNQVNSGQTASVDATEGGYVPKVTADLNKALADVAQALDYLGRHPELNALQIGPAAPETSKAKIAAGIPYAPGYYDFYVKGGRNNAAALAGMPKINGNTLDDLNAALKLLMNNSTEDYRGFVLGDLGGLRAKIMDDIAQAAADTRASMDAAAARTVAADTRPSRAPPERPAAPASPALETNPAPTAQAHLEAAQQALNQVMVAFDEFYNPGRLDTDYGGGFIEKMYADENQAATDVVDALTYVQAHPEVDPLPAGPALGDTLQAPRLPYLADDANAADTWGKILKGLRVARKVMANSSVAGGQGAVLGDLGGYRAKILADIGQAGSDISAGIDYSNARNPSDQNGVIPIPVAAPTAEAGWPRGPSALAGVALSAAISLGGLHFASRKRAGKT